MNKWKPQEIALAISKREEGKTWAKIAAEMYAEGWPKRSQSNYSSTIAKLSKKYDLKIAKSNAEKMRSMTNEKETSYHFSTSTTWREDPATRKQCKFIASLTLPKGTDLQKKALEHKLCVSAKEGNLTKEVAGQQIDLLGGSETKRTIAPTKEVRKTSNGGWVRWSKKEDAILMDYTEKGEIPPSNVFNNRTDKAISQRLYRLKRKESPVGDLRLKTLEANFPSPYENNTASTKEDYVSIHDRDNKPVRLNNKESKVFAKTNEVWAYDESLSLLVSFPEISIEEARETYERPYWVIAKHYEKHYDLTYAVSEELVMKATEIRHQMKRNMEPKKKPSLLKRWKLRRITKREKRLNRKLDKALTKLSKLQKKVNIDG
tara:strand:+ start:3119 stop:4243 length:1125 start_codon:yes stop_codon:yes gene_type:complete